MVNILRDIATISVLNYPLVLWLGLTTITVLFVTAYIGMSIMAGQRKFKLSVHVLLAKILIVLAIIHGGLALSMYI